MDKTKLRINLEFGINLFFEIIGFIAGIWVMILCTGGLALANEGLEEIKDSSIAMIFLGPFLLIAYAAIIILGVILGVIPAFISFATGVLNSLARFRYTEHGTAVTKGYRVLMITVYIVYGVFTAVYGTGTLLVLIYSTLDK